MTRPRAAWQLAGVLALAVLIRLPFGVDARAAWPLIAVAGAWMLARRFTRRPVLAVLLFLATPAFVLHASAFAALWLAAAALFVTAVDARSYWRLALAGVALALAAPQSALFGLVLALYVLNRGAGAFARRSVAVCALPMIVAAAYHPAGAAAVPNVKTALALTAQAGWLVFPLLAFIAFRTRLVAVVPLTAAAAIADPHPLFWFSFGAGAWILLSFRRSDKDTTFLHGWAVLFFAFAAVLFFDRSPLVPMAAAVAILTARALDHRPRWVAVGIALQLILSLALARTQYEQSSAWRDFVRELQPRFAGANVWLDGAPAPYGRPMRPNQDVRPGDWILSSRLGAHIPYRAAGAVVTVAERAVTPSLPIRISHGLRPFDFGTGPADVLRAGRVTGRAVTREYLNMNDPDAGAHILGGIYNLEAGQWRWTAGRAELVLKRPAAAARLEARVFIPEQSPARRITLAVDGVRVVETTLPGPGAHTVVSGVLPAQTGVATVSLTVDRTFTSPPDPRSLGVILQAIGFRIE